MVLNVIYQKMKNFKALQILKYLLSSYILTAITTANNKPYRVRTGIHKHTHTYRHAYAHINTYTHTQTIIYNTIKYISN